MKVEPVYVVERDAEVIGVYPTELLAEAAARGPGQWDIIRLIPDLTFGNNADMERTYG